MKNENLPELFDVKIFTPFLPEPKITYATILITPQLPRCLSCGYPLLKRKIAYLMSRFPHLPETFILREMTEMEAQGWEIGLFPLIHQRQAVIHSEAVNWLAKAHLLPVISIRILSGAIRMAIFHPVATCSIFFQIILGNIGFPRFLFRSLALFPKSLYLALIIEKENFAQIHAHYATYPALAAWIIHRLTGIPYTVTVHAHDIFESKPMLAVKLKDASLIVAISKYNRQYLIDCLGEWIGEKTRVVHCGIRPDDYPIRLLSPRQEEFIILNIGSLEPYKGQKYLIEAGRILAEKGFAFTIFIVGMGWERSKLQESIDRYGLHDKVFLLGPKTQEQVTSLLHQADCYVQPSMIMPEGTMEGIPVALMEAMACGLPVVATGISGIPELVEDKVNGLLVPPDDAQKLADAIESIALNRESAKKMGQNGRERVLGQFDLHKNVQELGLLFESLQEKSSSFKQAAG